MKTRFVSKVILFQETLEYQNAINLCYERQETQELQGCVPNAHTWAICKVVFETMLLVVKQCILNQIRRY
jgi:hypothetical protein